MESYNLLDIHEFIKYNHEKNTFLTSIHNQLSEKRNLTEKQLYILNNMMNQFQLIKHYFNLLPENILKTNTFINSLYNQFENKSSLSPKQIEKLYSLVQKYNDEPRDF
jgi:hypothetical protein